jgi:hypothetical protein
MSLTKKQNKKNNYRKKLRNKIRNEDAEFENIINEFNETAETAETADNKSKAEYVETMEDAEAESADKVVDLAVEHYDMTAKEYLDEFIKLKQHYDIKVKTDNKFLSYKPEYKISIFKDLIFNNIISKFGEIAWNLICNGFFNEKEAYEKISNIIENAKNAATLNNKLSENAAVSNPADSDKPEVVSGAKTTDEIIKIAEGIYKELKDVVRGTPDFVKWEDKKKLDLFRKKKEYDEFMTEFPIVSRYLICMGQYRSKAFRKMLEKVKLAAASQFQAREKGYNEDQWIRRNADYVRYLWESYQTKHYSQIESNFIWEDTYKKLKGEFDDFRTKYKDIEEMTKKEKEKHKAENAKDLLNRLNSGLQKLDDKDSENLKYSLMNLVYKRRYINTLKELKEKRQETEPLFVSKGRGAEEVVKDKRNVVTMVEHVDPARMSEIPEHLQLTAKEAQALPGYMNDEDD